MGMFIGTAQAQTIGYGLKGQFAGYNANGTNLVAVTPSCVPIELFGGAGDGTTDNLTPWNNLIASFGTNSGCVAFGAGKYKFTGAATAVYSNTTRQAISVFGAGADTSVLYFPNATDGLVFTMGATASPALPSARHFDHFRRRGDRKTALIVTDSTTGVGRDGTSHSIDDVTIRPDNTLQNTLGWFNGASFTGVSQLNVHGFTLFGVPASGTVAAVQASNSRATATVSTPMRSC